METTGLRQLRRKGSTPYHAWALLPRKPASFSQSVREYWDLVLNSQSFAQYRACSVHKISAPCLRSHSGAGLWAPLFPCMQGHIRAPTSGGPCEEEGNSIKFTSRAHLPPKIPQLRAANDRWRAAVLFLRLPDTRPCCPRVPCMAGGGSAHAPREEWT